MLTMRAVISLAVAVGCTLAAGSPAKERAAPTCQSKVLVGLQERFNAAAQEFSGAESTDTRYITCNHEVRSCGMRGKSE